MAATIDVQINFEGKSPIVAGDRRLSMLNLAQLLGALNHGSRYKQGNSYVQVQSSVVAATGTVTAAAVQVADTVSIGGQALTAAQRRAAGTVTCATAIAGNTFTINGQVFTGVAGAATLGEATFSIDTGNNETAASIVTQVLAFGGSKVKGIVAAKAAAAVVTFYAVNQGTSGNAITLASSDGATLAVSAATLANGSAIANNTFDMAGSNDTTAAAIAAAVLASTTAAVQQFTAASASAVCTFTSKVGGIAGNGLALISSNGTRLAVSGAGTFTGGSAGATTRWQF